MKTKTSGHRGIGDSFLDWYCSCSMTDWINFINTTLCTAALDPMCALFNLYIFSLIHQKRFFLTMEKAWKVEFQNVGTSYFPQSRVECHYSISSQHSWASSDWIGLFKVTIILSSPLFLLYICYITNKTIFIDYCLFFPRLVGHL